MSLATRCTSCGTVFRVVQDQLKVSEGWVRCGRCNQVFNALQALFDLERDPPADAAAVADAPVATTTTPPGPAAAEPAAAPTPPGIDLDLGAPGASDPLFEPFDARAGIVAAGHDAPRGHFGWNELRATPAGRVDARDRLEFPDARFDSEMLDDDAPGTASLPPAGVGESRDTATELPLLEADEPHFVVHAQRRARWNTPRMRLVQGALVVLLALLLGAQAVNHDRDLVAARWPASAPLLAAWCNALGCTIEAPRRIEDVVVESSALTRVALPDAFKLSVVLRNRGSVPVLPPSIDLSLTDVAGQPVARRVLSPRDFQAGAEALRPGADAPWQLVLAAGGAARVTGYTVEAFYP